MLLFDDINELADTCALCGESLSNGQSTNEEHIFPKWALKKYGLKGNIANYIGTYNKGQDFWRTKITVHTECNTEFGEKLEQKISNNDFTEIELWLWVMKIVCGLHFHEFRVTQNIPMFQPNAFKQKYQNDFAYLWDFKNEIFRYGKSEFVCPFTVIKLDYIFEEERFFHIVHFDLGIFWIALNGAVYLVFFRQKLTADEVLEINLLWDELMEDYGRPKSESEAHFLYNILVSRVSIHHYFNHRAEYFDFEKIELIPTQREWSIEYEDELFKSFGLKVIRDGTKIIRFESNN